MTELFLKHITPQKIPATVDLKKTSPEMQIHAQKGLNKTICVCLSIPHVIGL